MSNGPVLDYLDKSIATYDGDPASNEYQRGCLDGLKTARAELATVPIPMLLFCPRCGEQHLDAPDEAKGWANPPHRSHLCHDCGMIWRPCDALTIGVDRIQTFGSADTWSIASQHARGPAALASVEDLGDCELCDKPLALGQFVNQYDDVGTAHANCEAPFARPTEETPAPGVTVADDPSTMPTYVLLGEPALLFDVDPPPAEAVGERVP